MTANSHRTRKLRILLLSRYGRMGASSRLRFLQFFPYLKERGCTVEHVPMLDDQYLEDRYRGRVSYGRVLRAYSKRLKDLFDAGTFDLLWLEKEVLPWVPAWVELALLPRKIPMVVDYDDAIFHQYDEHHLGVVRSLLGTKIDAVMRRATIVTVGNEYLAQRAHMAGAKRVEFLPTVVDLERYPARERRPQSEPVVIGWIGSPATAGFLEIVSGPLERLRSQAHIRCVAIGARPDQLEGTPFEAVPWSEETEVKTLESLDIGIMPLHDAPWERGKCGYKLVQYMATGLPVVASPVGVNREIVEPSENGYLAATDDQWLVALERLISDADIRGRMGAAGRGKVESTYSLQAQVPRLLGFLCEAASGPRGARPIESSG